MVPDPLGSAATAGDRLLHLVGAGPARPHCWSPELACGDARSLDGNCRAQLGNQVPQTRGGGIARRVGCRQGSNRVGYVRMIVDGS